MSVPSLIYLWAVCQLAHLHSCKSRKEPSLPFPAPFHQGSLFSCTFVDGGFGPHPTFESVRTAARTFTRFSAMPPSHAVIFCYPCCSALSRTPGQLSPSTLPQIMLSLPSWLPRRGWAARLHVSSLSQPSGPHSTIEQDCSVQGLRLIRGNVYGWRGRGRFPFPVYSLCSFYILYSFCLLLAQK